MGVATYRTADELPGTYKMLAPIIEEVPKLLDAGAFEKNGEEFHTFSEIEGDARHEEKTL